MSKYPGYKLPESLKLRAIEYRKTKAGWKEIAQIFKKEGHLAPNDQPYHNALISSEVLKDPRGAFLRERSYKKKRKYTKRTVKSKSKTTVSVAQYKEATLSTKDLIEALQDKGVASDKILDLIKSIK